MECKDCVQVSTCKVLHEQLEKRCLEKHRAIDEDREAFKREIRDLFLGRLNEKAWGIVGKIAVAAATLYAALQQLLSAVSVAAK